MMLLIKMIIDDNIASDQDDHDADNSSDQDDRDHDASDQDDQNTVQYRVQNFSVHKSQKCSMECVDVLCSVSLFSVQCVDVQC